MKDLALDVDTHDALISDYDLSVVDDLSQVEQNLKIRLLFFYQEWFLDTSQGVRFFEDINVKNPDIPRIEALLKAMILETTSVTEITSFQMNFDNSLRKLTVNFGVNTTFGAATVSETL